MVVYGKAVFKCPKTGKDVTLHKDCIECTSFKHWGMVGARPFITCKEEEKKDEMS